MGLMQDKVVFGQGYEDHCVEKDCLVVNAGDYLVECQILVGADGVRSKVRENIGVEMHGKKSK